jgi:hypothetical protein
MATVLRTIGSIVAAMLVAFVLVVAVELFSAVVHPLPPDFGGTQEEVCQHVERYPSWVLAVVIPAWSATALTGTWIAGRLGNRGSALFLALAILATLILNLSMLPYPIWFKFGCLIAIPGASALGVYWSRRRNAADVTIAD